jgi:hypothetical protein
MDNQPVVGLSWFHNFMIFVKNFQLTDTVQFFEELKNIENRVAWFLANCVQGRKRCAKKNRNQRLTELSKGPA